MPKLLFYWMSKVYDNKMYPMFKKNYPEVPPWVCQRRILHILVVTGLVTHIWLTIWLVTWWVFVTYPICKVLIYTIVVPCRTEIHKQWLQWLYNDITWFFIDLLPFWPYNASFPTTFSLLVLFEFCFDLINLSCDVSLKPSLKHSLSHLISTVA